MNTSQFTYPLIFHLKIIIMIFNILNNQKLYLLCEVFSPLRYEVMHTKANRKFIRQESGVSAVIAMILIVALTVSLIAVAYAWINGLIPTGATASKTMQAIYDSTIATNKVTFSVVSADAGIVWTSINATAVDTEGVVNYVTDNISHSPAGQTELKVGQTFYIDCDDTWSGSYTFKLMYNDKIIWASSDISL